VNRQSWHIELLLPKEQRFLDTTHPLILFLYSHLKKCNEQYHHVHNRYVIIPIFEIDLSGLLNSQTILQFNVSNTL